MWQISGARPSRLPIITLLLGLVLWLSSALPESIIPSLLGEPWPLWLGVLMLALLNLAPLLTAERLWSIAWDYTLWGDQASKALSLDLGST